MTEADKRFMQAVEAELLRARAKFPGNMHQLAAFNEEAGELTKAMLDYQYGKTSSGEVYAEAVQAAAMALRVAIEGDGTMTYPGSHA